MRFGGYHISRELLLTADFMNTINGGVAMVTFKMKREENRYIAEIITPGLHPRDVKIEVKNNMLIIYHNLKFGEDGSYDEVQSIPFILNRFTIPYDVKITGIHAKDQTGILHIILPFNELANGYAKEIPIDES